MPYSGAWKANERDACAGIRQPPPERSPQDDGSRSAIKEPHLTQPRMELALRHGLGSAEVEHVGMAKRIRTVLKLQLPAGKATPAYPVGPALGPYGVNIMAVVKEYNERTA